MMLGAEPEPPYRGWRCVPAGRQHREDARTCADVNHFAKLGIAQQRGARDCGRHGKREVRLDTGEALPYDRLLIAPVSRRTAAEPASTCRTCLRAGRLDDARKILAVAKPGAEW